uniref:Mitochondrial carrier 1 n=1 Tax=Hucho hucho TaxID=62062 RepID=A0A4W5KCL2_9TELE
MINTWLKLFIFVSSGIDSGRGLFSCIAKIFKEEGVGGFFAGVVPHVLGEVIFLWCCNLLAHFINTYAVDNNFSQAPAVRSYTKFVMGIAVSVLTYPFMLVADLMAVNNCGVSDMKDKYRNVLTTFGRENEKVEQSKNSRTEEVYVLKWAHFIRLHFLRDVLEAGPSQDNLTTHDDEFFELTPFPPRSLVNGDRHITEPEETLPTTRKESTQEGSSRSGKRGGVFPGVKHIEGHRN